MDAIWQRKHRRAAVEESVLVSASRPRSATGAEFPTSVEAARASREAGLKVLMVAPNVVRGGSHSGNIAARDLADEGLLDVLSSDYVPFSLIHAVFALSDGHPGMRLPEAAALVTKKPAEAVRLDDRGSIAPGLRADLQRGAVEPTLVVRDIGLETLRETLDVIGAALEAVHHRYEADVEFTDMISRQALTIVKEWREELRPPDAG